MYIYTCIFIHVSLSLLRGGHVGFGVVLEVEHLMLILDAFGIFTSLLKEFSTGNWSVIRQ